MSSGERVKAEPFAVRFNGCLVEGDSRENARERRIKRCAIGVSIVLQTAGLLVLVIAPLFAKPAELAERTAVPIPPYSHRAAPRNRNPQPSSPHTARHCLYCEPLSIPRTVPVLSRTDDPPVADVFDSGQTVPTNGNGPIDIVDTRPQPRPPETPLREKRRLHVTQIDPALLTRRIEPVFPALARQLRKSGKVELHAVIATDGSVESLEVVSGDPWFVPSALEAVRQWRYRPTHLNGQPVEIDTYITVIYTLE